MQKESVVKLQWLLGLVMLVVLSCESGPQVLFEVEREAVINGSSVYIKQYAFGTDSLDAMTKEPLLIVHGGPVMEHSYFLPYLDELARDYQLIFYDQRACGKSSIEVDVATMRVGGFADDIELIRKELGFEKINLLGHSWGGMLAMNYGIMYPDRLSKLVLSSSMAPSSTDWQIENIEIGKRVTQADQDARGALMASGALQSEDPREAIRSLLLQSFKHQMYDSANLSKLNLFVPIDYLKRSQIFGTLAQDLQAYDLYPYLKKITCPTLLIYGETEPARKVYTSRVLQVMPNAQLEIIGQAGHFPFIEQPAAYNQKVIDFLKD